MKKNLNGRKECCKETSEDKTVDESLQKTRIERDGLSIPINIQKKNSQKNT